MNCNSTRNSVQGLQSVILLINDTSSSISHSIAGLPSGSIHHVQLISSGSTVDFSSTSERFQRRSSRSLSPFRVGQGFWVYGIQALFKSGIRYISAEIWVFGISHFFKFQVYSILYFPKGMKLDRFMQFKNTVQLKSSV